MCVYPGGVLCVLCILYASMRTMHIVRVYAYYAYCTRHSTHKVGTACSTPGCQYVDDYLIAGQEQAVEQLKTELAKHFQCKFNTPKDFLGLDITSPSKGEITLSMQSFTEKMQETQGYKFSFSLTQFEFFSTSL
jgi:hypothetical protein